ncbi:MAG TPA: ATP synthase F0 subunit B [Pyrinomonadaceae bacterium]|jgi:ATP synthase F0 subunit b|nr:ATP synthase F0 subunit B [Pyrinomonadaceae bacterium]
MYTALMTLMVLLVLAGEEGAGAPWWNRPGLELWKFVNLFLFIGALLYFIRRPVSDALRARREGIRRELMRAQEERDAANAKLEEVNARLARLDEETASLREQSRREAEEERERIRRSTEADAEKMREQARREIESAGKAARQDLRRYAAEQSVRLAEEMIRRDISPEDDQRLVNRQVEELGGIRR